MYMKTIKTGDTAQLTRKVSEEDVREMADISGDYNPIHLDEEYAKKTRFGSRIAHGLFCTAMISALLGNDLPGEGTIILSEQIDFLHPAYIGDTVTAQVTVQTVAENKHGGQIEFWCKNQSEKTLISGSVTVLW